MESDHWIGWTKKKRIMMHRTRFPFIVHFLHIFFFLATPLQAFVIPSHSFCSVKHRSSNLTPKLRGTYSTLASYLSLHVHKKHHVTLMGDIVPVLRKFQIGPEKFREIVANVATVTDKADIVVLCFLAFVMSPLSKFVRETLLHHEENPEAPPDHRKRTKAKKLVKQELLHLEKHGITNLINDFARVSLAVYLMDVFTVFMTTIGFAFPIKIKLAPNFARLAYSSFAISRFMLYKKMALCKFWNVDDENMGRLGIVNRIIDVVIVTISSLVLLDYLQIKMNNAMRGIFAFGGAGTLAFTLASRDIATQLLAGVHLIFSDKMYAGDVVQFGDGTTGKVIRLGWVETTLRGSDNLVTRVPNTLLSSQKVSNVSRIRQCQVKQTLRFHYKDVDKMPNILEDIREEIKFSCPRLITDNSRPFRVFWTNFNEDHLEVVVDTHHNIAPIGDAYWINRQNVLMAIAKALRKHDVEFAA